MRRTPAGLGESWEGGREEKVEFFPFGSVKGGRKMLRRKSGKGVDELCT